jgi:cephalosporin-C deacetylase-like acetyl esterase
LIFVSKPEWDGKRLLVICKREGGEQALVIAGLDNRITPFVAVAPLCATLEKPYGQGRGIWANPISSHGNN